MIMIFDITETFANIETAMGQTKKHNGREGYDYAMAVMK